MNPVILYDSDRKLIEVENGVVIPAGTRGFLAMGSDGTSAKNLKISPSGALLVTETTSIASVARFGACISAVAGTVAAQNLASIENPAASGKTVYVRRIKVSASATAAAAVNFQYLLGRTTATPTGGTAQTSGKLLSSSGAAVAIIRLSPTATAAAGPFWAAAGMVLQSQSYYPTEYKAWDSTQDVDDITLVAGEGLLVSAGGNDTDLSHTVSFFWGEA